METLAVMRKLEKLQICYKITFLIVLITFTQVVISNSSQIKCFETVASLGYSQVQFREHTF